MNFIVRWLERIGIGAITLLAIWLIVIQVFERLNQRLPLFFALAITYLVSAYIILPQVVRYGLMVVRRGRIPEVTRARDGLPADPVNILLIGSGENLIKVFEKAGWVRAEPVTIKTGWKMARAFVFDKPYPNAPISPHYMFGRPQDFGFQMQIGNSPRKRHHIRFWAANIDPTANPEDFEYWTRKHEVDPFKPLIWVGSGTEDIGFGFTKLTYQISHRLNKNVDEEREYILKTLRDIGGITNEHYVDSNRVVAGKYVTDGRILTATLLEQKDPVNLPSSHAAEVPLHDPLIPQV